MGKLAPECFQSVFIGAKDDEGGGDNWSYKTCKAQVILSPPTYHHPNVFTRQMPFVSPNQQFIFCKLMYKCTARNCRKMSLFGVRLRYITLSTAVEKNVTERGNCLPFFSLMWWYVGLQSVIHNYYTFLIKSVVTFSSPRLKWQVSITVSFLFTLLFL